MKTAATSVLVLVLAAMMGCQSSSSPRGGGMTKDVGFKIAVPTFATVIKQGETRSVPVVVERGVSFKQDVKLKLETTQGLTLEPTSIIVLSSDRPEVSIRLSAAADAALGEYSVRVTGVPKTGESTSTVFIVKVVSP